MFMVNHLIGFGAGGEAPASIAFVGHSFDAVDRSTYTFTSFVPADAGFYVVAVGSQLSGTPSITSITARGSSMGSAIVTTTTTNTRVSLYGVSLAAGSVGDLAVTFSATQVRCGVDIFRLDNLLSTAATATATDSTSPFTQSLSISDGGVGIGFYVHLTNGASITWSGLTKNGSDEPGESSYVSSVASIGPVGAQTLSVTATPSSGTAGALVLAAFR